MIIINSIKYSDDLSSIELDISSTTLAAKFLNIYLWDINTFRNYEESLDASDLIVGQTNQEIISIAAEKFGLDKFNGLYFIEFNTNESSTPFSNGVIPNQTLGVVYNSYVYKECLLNKVAELEIKGCDVLSPRNCEDCVVNTNLLTTLIYSVDNAIEMYLYEEAIKILKDVENLCDICHNCPQYEDITSYNGQGLGYYMIDNTVIPN